MKRVTGILIVSMLVMLVFCDSGYARKWKKKKKAVPVQPPRAFEPLKHELELFNVAAMERVIKDLAKDYPKKYDEAKLLAELKKHSAQLEGVLKSLTEGGAGAEAKSQAICDWKR